MRLLYHKIHRLRNQPHSRTLYQSRPIPHKEPGRFALWPQLSAAVSWLWGKTPGLALPFESGSMAKLFWMAQGSPSYRYGYTKQIIPYCGIICNSSHALWLTGLSRKSAFPLAHTEDSITKAVQRRLGAQPPHRQARLILHQQSAAMLKSRTQRICIGAFLLYAPANPEIQIKTTSELAA